MHWNIPNIYMHHIHKQLLHYWQLISVIVFIIESTFISNIKWRSYVIFNIILTILNKTSLRISILPIKFSYKNQTIPNAANCLVKCSNKHQHACKLNMTHFYDSFTIYRNYDLLLGNLFWIQCHFPKHGWNHRRSLWE